MRLIEYFISALLAVGLVIVVFLFLWKKTDLKKIAGDSLKAKLRF